MDTYQMDYDACDKEVRALLMTLEEVKSIKEQNPSQPTTKQDYSMKQSSTKLRTQIQALQVLSNEMQNSGSRFNISAKDRQKRIDKITQLDKQVQEAIQSYNVYVQYKSGQIADDEQPLMRGPQGADGEYDNTRDKTNQ